ncbi:hypothetical protein [uncultured Thiodictyon sp.]|uniref:hypothetical protein n=1 Tax=uncultured Thiodictyon sp. TaxID=1846217 RepID=UPI0025D4BD1C|nr:hypothetical protein [uncultured Thiodictyon sp.]
MGGLVTKRMLKVLEGDDSKQLRQVKAVIFFSTPAHGSDVAAIANWVSSNPQFGDMRPSDFNAFLQVLDNDWRDLLRHRSVDNPFPRAFCAYETLSTAFLKIVPRSSAESGCDETPAAFDRDHSSIVKPTSADDEVHKFLRARIASTLEPRLIPQEVTVKLVKADGTLLDDAAVLRSGEQYSLQISSRRSAWFYVFNSASLGL